MPTYDITSPDGKTYEVTAPEGASQDQVLQYVQQQHAAPAAPSPAKPVGQPPTLLQTMGASPLGRFAHDAIYQPITGLAGMLDKMDPTGGFVGPANERGEKTYQEALAAQRNRPGYAEARTQADTMAQKRGAGGLMDQFIAPLTSAAAGLAGLPGGLNSSNAAADAQTAAQSAYQQANPKSSFLAQMGGGLLMAPKMPAPSPAATAAPSIAHLKTAAGQAYDRVDAAGHIVSDTAYDKMVADLQAKLANEGVDKTLHPNALAAFNRISEVKGTPITFKGLDTQRKIAGDAIGASTMNKADQRLGYMIQDHIDDFVGNLKPHDLMGGTDPTQTIADLAEARDLWSKASQASTIQKQIDKAGIKASANYSQSGYENALRKQFTSLALNDKAMARLSQDVREAVKDVAKGGTLGNLLRSVGKYAPHGPVATGAGMGVGYMLGGVEGGGMGALAMPAIGEAARVGATNITKAAAQRALQTAASGSTPPRIPALQRPSLPGQLPYGLSLPLLMQTQH